MVPRRRLAIALRIAALVWLFASLSVRPSAAQPLGVPTATLVPTTTLTLPGGVDSNSPAVWDLVGGRRLLQVFTSIGGQPSYSRGRELSRLGPPMPVNFVTHPGHGVWLEGVVTDEGGTWYGYYHNEVPAVVCGRPDRMVPRIGAARSTDRGRTWEDLGVVLEAPPGLEHCTTPNKYFVGGVGDVGVVLDPNARYLYLYFSQYSRPSAAQGLAVARLEWAARDEPVGRLEVWNRGIWQPADRLLSDDDESREIWRYPAGTPLVAVKRPWHDSDPLNDAFWGASVHWNAFLQQYVMLLNRTKDEDFNQEGIYVSFSPSLEDPTRWSAPERILAGGRWYPQVIGLEWGEGSDDWAGARARFFMGGSSSHFIEFGVR